MQEATAACLDRGQLFQTGAESPGTDAQNTEAIYFPGTNQQRSTTTPAPHNTHTHTHTQTDTHRRCLANNGVFVGVQSGVTLVPSLPWTDAPLGTAGQ